MNDFQLVFFFTSVLFFFFRFSSFTGVLFFFCSNRHRSTRCQWKKNRLFSISPSFAHFWRYFDSSFVDFFSYLNEMDKVFLLGMNLFYSEGAESWDRFRWIEKNLPWPGGLYWEEPPLTWCLYWEKLPIRRYNRSRRNRSYGTVAVKKTWKKIAWKFIFRWEFRQKLKKMEEKKTGFSLKNWFFLIWFQDLDNLNEQKWMI